MRLEQSVAGSAGTGVQCGGFRVVFEEAAPVVRLVPGERLLPEGMTAAVLHGLSRAHDFVSGILRVRGPARAYDRVEVALGAGAETRGRASSLGAGYIRLSLGENTSPEDAGRIACHEALHLLLASSLPGGERWNDPDLAFADWIVCALEAGLAARLPRFHPPFPQLLDPVPTSRLDVQRQLATVASAPAAARRYFGEPLFAELNRIEADAEAGTEPAAIEQRQLWLVEAAIGTHYLEAAGRVHLEHGERLRSIVLDDWLADYEQYARAVANPPASAGNLWRMSERGWSRDPFVRLSVAAQALQCDDRCFFAGERYGESDEPVIWKNRGRVRLPLLPAPMRPRPAPIHGFRVVLRDLDGPDAAPARAAVEHAARGGADLFEARALWPRILARLLAANLPAPAIEGAAASVPVVQLVECDDGGAVEQAFGEWTAAAAALRGLAGECAAWVPCVAEPKHVATIAEGPHAPAAMQLVYAAPLSAPYLLTARRLAAQKPVRGALFRDHLDRGSAHEHLPDLDEALDPRYREDVWVGGLPPPRRLHDLVATIDEDTVRGRLTTPASYLLSMMAVGLEECHCAPPRADAPPAERG